MDNRTATKILRRLKDLERNSIRLRQGVMSGTSAVKLGGSDVASTGIGIFGTPRSGERVSVLSGQHDGLVLGRSGGIVDLVDSAHLVTPANDAENGVVVKVPSNTYGKGSYGTGQPIMVLREDYTGDPKGGSTAEPDRNVVFRVDRYGGVGCAGGLHVALGLRNPDQSPAPTQSIWVSPSISAHGIIVDTVPVPVGSFETYPIWVRANGGNDVRFIVGTRGEVATYSADNTWPPGYILGRGSGNIEGRLLVTHAQGQYVLGAVAGDLILRSEVATRRVHVGFSDHAMRFQNLGGAIAIGHSQRTDYALAQTPGGATYLTSGAGMGITLGSQGSAGRISAKDEMLGFHGTAPVAKQTITGAGSGAALADLLTKLASTGLITNSTTGVTPEAWHEVGAAGEPAFQNGWVNFGGIYGTAAFRKDPFGTVYLKGMVKSGTLGSNIYVLPVGYRPAARGIFASLGSNAVARIDVDSDGSVFVNATLASSAWMTLNGITFRAAE